MKQLTSQFGYSLVEVLVSISILMIAIIGPITIAVQGIKSSAFTLQQNTASFLAQEGLEAVFSLRNDYALQELDGTVTDGWLAFRQHLDKSGSGPCVFLPVPSTSDPSSKECKFGLSFNSTGNLIMTSDECLLGSADNKCLLYRDTANAPFVYAHDNTGTPTPYTRIITVTVYDHFGRSRMSIESEVFWTSSVFSGVEQQVKVYSMIFDLI